MDHVNFIRNLWRVFFFPLFSWFYLFPFSNKWPLWISSSCGDSLAWSSSLSLSLWWSMCLCWWTHFLLCCKPNFLILGEIEGPKHEWLLEMVFGCLNIRGDFERLLSKTTMIPIYKFGPIYKYTVLTWLQICNHI